MPRTQPAAFVGRVSELGAAREVLADAVRGRASAALVHGAAGQGKTTLLEQALGEVPGGTVTTLRAACLPTRAVALPLASVRMALRRRPDDLPPPPELSLSTEALAEAPPALDAWLDDVCRLRPVLLAIDDLQWADGSTLDLLMYLLSGPSERALAVLATVRTEEQVADHELRAWCADVRRRPGLVEISLPPLSGPETGDQLADLLGGSPHRTLVEDVHRRSGGNAYFNRLLVSGLDLSVRHLPASLPTSLREALAAGWHRLEPGPRHLASLVALAGLPLTARDLGTVVGAEQPDLDLEAALAGCVAAGVLRTLEDGTCWFAHPLQAEVLRDQLPRDEQRRWHRLFAALLEARQGRDDLAALVQLADHHAAADHPADAFAAAVQAADVAETVAAHTTAAALVEQAVSLLPRLARPAELRTSLLRRLRRLREAAGDAVGERSAVEQLLAGDGLTDLEVAELVVRRIHLRQSLAEAFGADDDLRTADRLTAAHPDAWQRAYVLAERSRDAMWRGDPASVRLAEEAVAAARRSGEPRASGHALVARAIAEQDHGDPARAAELARAGQRAALEAGDHWCFLHATFWVANATDAWMTAAYRDVVQAGYELGLERGVATTFLSALVLDQARIAVVLGEPVTGAGLLRSLAGAPLLPLHDAGAHFVAARLALLQGRPAEARAELERAEEISGTLAGFTPMETVTTRIELDLASGNLDQAAATAMAALDDAGLRTMCEWSTPLAARALADLHQRSREQGDPLPDAPAAWLTALEARFPPTLDGDDETLPVVVDGYAVTAGYRRVLTALASWYVAECGRAHGRPDNGVQWQEAVRRLEEAGLRWEAAYAGQRTAEALLRTSPPDRHGARAALRTAAAQARLLGARPVLERVERLARAARTSLAEPAPRRAPAGLTRREQEVLDLVVAGRTYREIAETLVLSEKTVSSHISHMLHKTGAANRVELASRTLGPDGPAPAG